MQDARRTILRSAEAGTRGCAIRVGRGFDGDLSLEEVSTEEFRPMEKLSQCPIFRQFLDIYARQHCEGVQTTLHYNLSHIS
jgi:hypothetical protein